MSPIENRSLRRPRALAAAALLALAAGGCAQPETDEAAAPPPTEQPSPQPASSAEVVERGRYLVAITGCNDCHTPFEMGPAGPQPDMTRMLSGHPEGLVLEPPPAPAEGSLWLWSGAATNTAFAGPWGISYASNLTPDEGTGIGIWTEEIFVGALRSGRHWGQSRPILPPMPWPAYAQMTDEDLSAVYAYLRTIPAIANRVPEARLAGQPAADDDSFPPAG